MLRTASLACLGLIASVTAVAQTPAQRDSIERFREAVAALTDADTLRALESAMIDRARVDRDNALLHVQLGFLALRLGDVTGNRQHYDDAGSEFEWAGELEPTWPFAWYGLGLAELALGEVSIIALENIRQALGKDFLSKAAAAFGRAAEVDPAFADAVVDLAETAMRQRVRPQLTVAHEAVRKAAATEAGDVPAVQLARGRLERTMGEGDSALAAFEEYLELGGDSGVGYLEMARTQFFLRYLREAEATYFAGAGLAHTREGVGMYREDLSWAATPEELAAFDSVTVAQRADWLRRFWLRRDVADARHPGERLAEHYRRYFYALRNYRLVSRHRRYDVVHPYRNEQQVFDDRGIIYMRHGEPSRRAVHNAPGVNPNESWLYERPEGSLIFHFAARDDVQDYKLVESLVDVFGLDTAIALQTSHDRTPGFVGELFASRLGLDPVYQRLASMPFVGRASALAAERRAGDRAIDVGTTTDSHLLRFETSLGAVVRRYVVGDSAGGGGRLLVVYAIPGGALEADQTEDRVAYPVQIRLLAATADDSAAGFVDTVRVWTAQRPLEPDQHLSGYVTLPVAAGDYTMRIVLGQPWRNAGELHTDTVVVPDFSAPGLTISDLIIGRHGSGLTWVVGGDTVALSPLPSFPVEARLRVYYELHGLTKDAPYRARLEVARQRGGGPPITLTFDGVATGRVTRVSHTVDISGLRPGRYRLRVTVEDIARNLRVEREAVLDAVGS